MPYKSRKQEKYMNAAAARGDVKQSVVDEFNAASKGKKLPEKAPDPEREKHKRIFKNARKAAGIDQ